MIARIHSSIGLHLRRGLSTEPRAGCICSYGVHLAFWWLQIHQRGLNLLSFLGIQTRVLMRAQYFYHRAISPAPAGCVFETCMYVAQVGLELCSRESPAPPALTPQGRDVRCGSLHLVLLPFSKTGFAVAQAGLKLALLPARPPGCWDNRNGQPCLVGLTLTIISPDPVYASLSLSHIEYKCGVPSFLYNPTFWMEIILLNWLWSKLQKNRPEITLTNV